MKYFGEVVRLLERRGNDAYLGENVSQTEHALQAAALAEKADSPPSLVLAALLHDVGHLLLPTEENLADRGEDGLHEIVGYQWLLSRFGQAVAEPVRLHVAAKRYLCGSEPEYFAGLSSASVQSLSLQGGPYTEAESGEFEKLPFFREAVLVRRWDDSAKTVGLAVPDLHHYRDLFA